jgi:hypothetical protein
VWSSTMRYMESIVHSEDFAACNIYSWAEQSWEREEEDGGRPSNFPNTPPSSSPPSSDGCTAAATHNSRRRAHEKACTLLAPFEPSTLYTQHTVEYLSALVDWSKSKRDSWPGLVINNSARISSTIGL